MPVKKIGAVLLLVILIAACSRDRESTFTGSEDQQSQTVKSEAEPPLPEKERIDDAVAENGASLRKRSIDPRTVLPAIESNERMLEYTMSLRYESDDILDSRRKLMNIVSRYGYLSGSSTQIDDDYQYLNLTCRVKTDSIYNMLGALASIGRLKHEDVSVTDMTGENVQRTIRQKTEMLRTRRREEALRDYNLSTIKYEQREMLLQQSEDNLDQLEYELWQLEDRAAWSTVTVTVERPQSTVNIVIPSFHTALIQMINGLLFFLYGIVRFLPFIAVVALLILKRHAIMDFIARRKPDTDRKKKR